MAASPKTGDLELGRKIAARRDELKMSRKQLAEAAGVSYPYIAQIETGYRLPSSRHQLVLAKILGISLDELFGTDQLHSIDSKPGPDFTMRRSARPSVDEVIDRATGIIESLPPSVRIEALSRIQMRVMQGVVDDERHR